MNRKRILLAVALLLPVLIASVILLADMIGGNPRTILADGRKLTVRGISKGISHRFVHGNVGQRIAALALPDRWSQKLGAVTYRQITGHPAHVVWIELDGDRRGIYDVWLADEAGTFIPAVALKANPTPGNRVYPYMFFAMPTASRQVEVIVDTGTVLDDLDSLTNRRKLGGALQFRNPTYLQEPKWRGKPPPIAIEQDELSVHLDYFGPSREVFVPTSQEENKDVGVPGKVHIGPLRSAATGYSPTVRWSRTELACRIYDHSNTTNIWKINHVGIANEAGSDWVPGSQIGTVTATHALLRFTGRLGTNAFWKLRLNLSRPTAPALDKLSKRSAPHERTIELIAQPGG